MQNDLFYAGKTCFGEYGEWQVILGQLDVCNTIDLRICSHLTLQKSSGYVM